MGIPICEKCLEPVLGELRHMVNRTDKFGVIPCGYCGDPEVCYNIPALEKDEVLEMYRERLGCFINYHVGYGDGSITLKISRGKDGDETIKEIDHIPDAKKMVEPDNDGWIDHDGGECPVDGETMVDVKYRDGDIQRKLFPAETYRWTHYDTDRNFYPIYDIVKYRVVTDE